MLEVLYHCAEFGGPRIRDVHGTGKDRDPMGPMGFPWEWEYDQPWDGNGMGMGLRLSLIHISEPTRPY